MNANLQKLFPPPPNFPTSGPINLSEKKVRIYRKPNLDCMNVDRDE